MDAIEQLKENVETSPEVTSIRSAGFRLLLETGEPVEKTTWAEKAALSLDELDEILSGTETKGLVQLDDDGLLIGVAGLTVVPTTHRITIDGETRYTWCALDVVGIFGALGASGSVHSTDPGTGEAIDISFTDGKPDGDATLFILGGYDGGDVVTDWCPLVNFFASDGDARAWADANGLEGDIVSMAGIAQDSANMWRSLLDAGAPDENADRS